MNEEDLKLLDRFAGQAMQALLQAQEETYLREARAWEEGELDIEEAGLGYDHIDIADAAYHMAGEMLVARASQIEMMEIEHELQENGELEHFLQSDVYTFFQSNPDIPVRMLNSTYQGVAKEKFLDMSIEEFQSTNNKVLVKHIRDLGVRTIEKTKEVIRQEIQRLKNDNENEGK